MTDQEKFKHISVEEFNKIPGEELNKIDREIWKDGINPFAKRCCADCVYMKPLVNWWCTNEGAAKFRGTKIPGIYRCAFWAPNWEHISEEYKTPENGYVPPVIYTAIDPIKISLKLIPTFVYVVIATIILTLLILNS